MIIPFSKKLQEKLQKDNAYNKVFSHMNKLNLVQTVIYYIIDSKTRKAINLKHWIKTQQDNIIIQNLGKRFRELYNNQDEKMLAILKFWSNKRVYKQGFITYVGDLKNYNMNEHWATVDETIDNKSGDCEDGAIGIYLTAKASGISDNRIWIVAGNVVGGGHAYVVYRANDGVEYPIDWCYWNDESRKMKKPYNKNSKYYKGTKEWFRFNLTDMYHKVYK